MLLMLLLVASVFLAKASPVLMSMEDRSDFSQTPIIKEFHSSSETTDDKPPSRKCDLWRRNSTFRADCCCRNMTKVPDNLPQNITYLDLRNNNISALPDNCFSRYTDLRFLYLSFNLITKLSNSSFNGLTRLEHMNLGQNNLHYVLANFPLPVFKPLKRLMDLYLNRNNPDAREPGLIYPDAAMSELTSLTTLYMDGLKDAYFGPGFRKLKRLSTLVLKGYKNGACYLNSLKNKTFENLRNLRRLDLASCYIRGNLIENGTFSPLINLEELILTHNEDIGVENLQRIFFGLRNAKNLTYLNFHLVVNRYSLSVCLESKYLKYFPQSVVRLNVKENNLEAVDRKVTQILANVKELDISGNKFVFGTYLKDLPKLSNLSSISFNGGGFTYNLPKIYPYEAWLHHPPSPFSREAPSSCSLYNRNNAMLRSSDVFILRLPPKLTRIEMANVGLTYILSRFMVDENNVLEKLSLPGNHFPRLEGPIEGLVKLKHLNISNCGVRTINNSFFSTFKSLEILDLSNNLLNLYFRSPDSTKVFHSLTMLKELNLSGNALTFLAPDALEGLDNVEYLYLQDNKIYEFCIKISHMHRLRLLDLHNNRIKILEHFTRHSIDTLLHKGVPFTVSLAHAPIACICANVDFLQWMSTSRAFQEGFDGYFCSLPDFTSRQMRNGFAQMVVVLRRECESHEILFLIVATCSAAILVIIVVFICYRFRFKLLYLYYMAYLLHQRRPNSQQMEFQYDAFICYADEDQEFVEIQLEPALLERGLHIFLHARDFVAGEYINSNIVKAVSVCRKTVVVLTKAMLKSNWCRFEVQMANLESVYTGRRVLIFLLLEAMPQRNENLEVFYNIQRNTYCVYPGVNPGEQHINLMWDRLVRDIQN